jgi:hypothetical protein
MMIALGLRIYGNEAAGEFIGIFSLLVLVSVLLFAGNMLMALRRASKIVTAKEPVAHSTVMGVVA